MTGMPFQRTTITPLILVINTSWTRTWYSVRTSKRTWRRIFIRYGDYNRWDRRWPSLSNHFNFSLDKRSFPMSFPSTQRRWRLWMWRRRWWLTFFIGRPSVLSFIRTNASGGFRTTLTPNGSLWNMGATYTMDKILLALCPVMIVQGQLSQRSDWL